MAVEAEEVVCLGALSVVNERGVKGRNAEQQTGKLGAWPGKTAPSVSLSIPVAPCGGIREIWPPVQIGQTVADNFTRGQSFIDFHSNDGEW